jgi:hypothetical protein
VFSLATFGNGIVAILGKFYRQSTSNFLAGLIADQAASTWGYVAPFMLALSLLVTGSLIVSVTWQENYGDSSVDVAGTFQNAITDLTKGTLFNIKSLIFYRTSCSIVGYYSIFVRSIYVLICFYLDSSIANCSSPR